MRVGFTGTQRGMTEAQAEVVRACFYGAIEVHLGDCIGADAQALEIAYSLNQGIRTFGHVPTNDAKRHHGVYHCELAPKPYLVRNRAIVDVTDVLVATPSGFTEELRSGTWATVRHARRTGKPVVVIYPDGTHDSS